MKKLAGRIFYDDIVCVKLNIKSPTVEFDHLWNHAVTLSWLNSLLVKRKQKRGFYENRDTFFNS